MPLAAAACGCCIPEPGVALDGQCFIPRGSPEALQGRLLHEKEVGIVSRLLDPSGDLFPQLHRVLQPALLEARPLVHDTIVELCKLGS
jgi:hypothetical protein